MHNTIVIKPDSYDLLVNNDPELRQIIVSAIERCKSLISIPKLMVTDIGDLSIQSISNMRNIQTSIPGKVFKLVGESYDKFYDNTYLYDLCKFMNCILADCKMNNIDYNSIRLVNYHLNLINDRFIATILLQ